MLLYNMIRYKKEVNENQEIKQATNHGKKVKQHSYEEIRKLIDENSEQRQIRDMVKNKNKNGYKAGKVQSESYKKILSNLFN